MLARINLKRTLAAVVLAGAALVTAQTRAQVQDQAQPGGFGQDISPEDAEMFQQMQQFGQQMFQNMQTAGIDPQELFGNVGQQMQDGTFDPDAMQQLLIDKGVITPDMMNQMQGTMQKYNLSSIRRELNPTDDEWAILQTKITRILNAQADVNINKQAAMAGGGMGGGMATPPSQTSEAAKALKDLKATIKQQNTPESTIATKLQVWRAAHEKAQVELATAQDELVKILTLRQEAVLVRLGVL